MLRSRTRAIGRAALFACLAGVFSIAQLLPVIGSWSVVFQRIQPFPGFGSWGSWLSLFWAALELLSYWSDLAVVLHRPVFTAMPTLDRAWGVLVTGHQGGVFTEVCILTLILVSSERIAILISWTVVAGLLAIIISLWETQYQAVVYIFTHVYPQQLQSIAVHRAE